MREFPVTVSSSHIYHINSSASNLFDDDQYQRKLPAIESDINCSRFHHQTTSAGAAAATAAIATAKQSYPNNASGSKNATNYICTSNGDLTSLQSGRLQNFTNINNIHNTNNNCNRSHKVVTAIKSTNSATSATAAAAAAIADKNVDLHNRHEGDIICADMNRASNATNPNGPYSIFDALTNAVTTGHCANTIYPTNEQSDTADFDQINLSPDPLTVTSTSIHNLKNPPSSHINNECGQFQHYNYHHFNNNRTHQFPSTNYKHSYLLWIGTPVAARYCVTISNKKFIANFVFAFCVCSSIFLSD